MHSGRFYIWYTPKRKCRSFWTWLFFVSAVCGRRAYRVCGWDIYPRFDRTRNVR